MHPDHIQYMRFTSRARLDKSLNSLLGIVEGIALDGEIAPAELAFLKLWLDEHGDVKDRHPYNELIPVVGAALEDGVLTRDERDDITWLCEQLCSTEFTTRTTADLQRLHAILGGTVSDGAVTEAELKGLSAWLREHENLKTCWPYDEVDSLVLGVMKDGRVDGQEHSMLKSFFSEFVAVLDDRTIARPVIEESATIVGLCAVCPEIEFKGASFCFTGASSRYTRQALAEIAERLGGEVTSSVTKKTAYFVIGADGNPCWAYACYGRKVEKAVELRKAGIPLLIVHEHDFHDAAANAR